MNRTIRMHFRFRSTKATRVYYRKSLLLLFFGFWRSKCGLDSITHHTHHISTLSLKMQKLCSLVCIVVILISLVVGGSASNAAVSGGSLIAKVGPAHRRQQQQSFGSNGYHYHHHHQDTRRSSLGTNNLNEVQDCVSPLAKNLARGAFLRIASDMYVALDIYWPSFFFFFFFV